MPIYEYRCASCGFQKEYLQKVNSAPLSECPQCGKPSFNKMVTAAGFQLKGSGWYVTDFKNNGTAKPAAQPDAAKADGSGEAAKADAASGNGNSSNPGKPGNTSETQSGDAKASAPKADTSPAAPAISIPPPKPAAPASKAAPGGGGAT